jgi:hypothetical protein
VDNHTVMMGASTVTAERSSLPTSFPAAVSVPTNPSVMYWFPYPTMQSKVKFLRASRCKSALSAERSNDRLSAIIWQWLMVAVETRPPVVLIE